MSRIEGTMSAICFDCPHSITGEALLKEGEMEELEYLAAQLIRHACHNHSKLLCLGQIKGCYAVIEGYK